MLAGGITPDNLAAATKGSTTGTFTLNTTAGTYQDTGITLTLPSSGTYLICADVRVNMQVATGTTGFVTFKIVNHTDTDADVTNSETMVALVNDTLVHHHTASCQMIITVAASKQLNIWAKRDNATTWAASSPAISSDANGRTRFSYVKLSS